MALPDFLEKLIAAPPAAGTGVHDWLFRVARNLHAHMPATQIEALLRARCNNCGRHVPDSEIRAAIKNSMDCAWSPNPTNPQPKPQPVQPDLALIEKLVSTDYKVADLFHESPIHWDDDCAYTEDVIDKLFPGNPLLCCGKSATSFDTKPRAAWRGELSKLSFMVPSPMSAITGKTKDGRISKHTIDNTGPRRFIVIEFDFSEFSRDGKTPTPYRPMLQRLAKRDISVHDMCANLLLRINRVKPMTLAVCSGGKSIHGWWYCHGLPESDVKKFHDFARIRGADPATFRPSQFVRIPDGTRDNGKQQTILYFDPCTLT